MPTGGMGSGDYTLNIHGGSGGGGGLTTWQEMANRASSMGHIYYDTHTYPTWGGNGNSMINAGRSQDDKHVEKAMKEVKDSLVIPAPINEKAAKSRGALLKELGFDKLHSKVTQIAERATKENLAALAGFKKIPWAKFQEADTKLRANTQAYKMLALTKVSEYIGQHANRDEVSLPPQDVLEKMAAAKKAALFDDFAIIHVVLGPDPILVGTIKGTKDMFFIAEWGDDIKMSDIV